MSPSIPLGCTSKSALQVYDGQQLLGEIEDLGHSNVVAFKIQSTGRRIKVGTFPTRILAMRALSTAHIRGQHVP
jgi:hypothetical protein